MKLRHHQRVPGASRYQALQIAHRGYVLETGRVVLADEASRLAKNPQVKAAYLGG